MKKSTKQTLLGGVAVTCLLVIAPGVASDKNPPFAPLIPTAVAAVCCYFGELDELVDEGVKDDEV